MYKKPILNFSAISSLLCRRFCRLSILELYSQKMVRVHSALYLQGIIFQLRIVWEIVFWLIWLCVGKGEVALLYNWLVVFRLSISAWNTEKQNQYQDSPIQLFLVYYSSISLLWLYSLYFCKTYVYIFFCHVDIRFPIFIIFLPLILSSTELVKMNIRIH
jgi:hypothetical protein